MKHIPGIHYELIEHKINPISDYIKHIINPNEVVKSEKRVFESGSQRDNDINKPLVNHLDAYVRLRFGYLLRMGANKYEKNNWQKGQPTEVALESLHRHLAKYEMGDRSEDHLACIIFGIQLIMKNEQKEGIKIDEYYENQGS